MGKPRVSQSFTPSPGWTPPATAFFAALCGVCGGGIPEPPTTEVQR
jgi:hypothetical protein